MPSEFGTSAIPPLLFSDRWRGNDASRRQINATAHVPHPANRGDGTDTRRHSILLRLCRGDMLLMWLNIMLLVLGTALDLAPLLLICTPILLPVIKQFGIDPVHFGIVMLLNLGIGLLTPPVGTTLFVGCAIGKVSVDDVMREIWPFYYVMLLHI